MISGDNRPPLVPEAFTRHALYTWDEIDLGIPSIYMPRMLNPLYFFTVFFQMLGTNVYLSQMIATFLIYFLTSIFMYIYVKQITNNDTITSFIATIFLTSNVHLISDREQTAIGFMNMILMILPCLVTFTKGIKTKSYKMLLIASLLFTLTYGTFPNYRTSLICLIALAITYLFFILKETKINYHSNKHVILLGISFNKKSILTYIKHLLMFIPSLFLASIWIITIITMNLRYFYIVAKEIATPPFVTNLKFHDVFRLIAKWSFYSGALGKPYVPYAHTYLHDPLVIILSYLPSILAFSSLLISKQRKLTLFFSSIAVIFLILTSGFNPHFNKLYIALVTHIPLLIAFRESTNWIFFVLLSYSILIGITCSTLYHKLKNRVWKIFWLSLIVSILLSASYPLVTGDVTRNWLNPKIKGSYFPSSYVELNDMLSSKYWSILLPQRGTYVVYNFTEGTLGCGNPYPHIFSKPIISGSGTEYILSENLGLINKIYEVIPRNVVCKNIASEGDAFASSIGKGGCEPDKAIDNRMRTMWYSRRNMPQWLEIEWDKTQTISEIKILFGSAYAEDYKIASWDGHRWVTQVTVENNKFNIRKHIFYKPIHAKILLFYFTKAAPFDSVSIREIKVYTQTRAVSKFLGMIGIKHLILEKNIVLGNLSSINNLKLNDDGEFILVKEWKEVALFKNLYALEKIYVANNIIKYSSLDEMYGTIRNLEWSILEHSVFINAPQQNETNKTLLMPEDFVWVELSPIIYEVHVKSNGPFILVFLENYDREWKAYVNGIPIPEINHYRVNGFANGWLINTTGKLTITIKYEPQSRLVLSLIASTTLPIFLLIFLIREEIKRTIPSIQHILKKVNFKIFSPLSQ